jgi:hypothetical protein
VVSSSLLWPAPAPASGLARPPSRTRIATRWSALQVRVPSGRRRRRLPSRLGWRPSWLGPAQAHEMGVRALAAAIRMRGRTGTCPVPCHSTMVPLADCLTFTGKQTLVGDQGAACFVGVQTVVVSCRVVSRKPTRGHVLLAGSSLVLSQNLRLDGV